jgi:hypothetical protein
MYKLITFILAVIPVILFLRAIFPGQSKKWSQATSDFMKQLDFLVWVILIFFACAIVYSIGKLVLG